MFVWRDFTDERQTMFWSVCYTYYIYHDCDNCDECDKMYVLLFHNKEFIIIPFQNQIIEVCEIMVF